MEFLHCEVGMIDLSRDDRIQRRAFRQRVEAQHFAELLSISFPPARPILPRVDICQAGVGQLACLVTKVSGDHLIAASRVRRYGAERATCQSDNSKECQDYHADAQRSQRLGIKEFNAPALGIKRKLWQFIHGILLFL